MNEFSIGDNVLIKSENDTFNDNKGVIVEVNFYEKLGYMYMIKIDETSIKTLVYERELVKVS